MAVNFFSNANLTTGLCAPCANGFIPAATYAYDAAAKTVTITQASTIPAGDSFGKLKATVTDEFGNEIKGATTSSSVPLVISTATLNASKRINLQVAIFTTAKLFADGSAYDLQVAGDVANFDKSN